jgi:hypothetical protein
MGRPEPDAITLQVDNLIALDDRYRRTGQGVFLHLGGDGGVQFCKSVFLTGAASVKVV